MANIKLNNNSYPIPDSVLAGPTADFVAHLGTIAGDGLKVVVGGVEYGIDATKVAGAISGLNTLLGSLHAEPSMAPGLYQTGAIALFREGNIEDASAMMTTSWEDLEASGAIAISEGEDIELPEMNEYGFYFGVPYCVTMYGQTVALTFNKDCSVIMSQNGVIQEMPAGTIVYGDHSIDMSAVGLPTLVVSADGTAIEGDGLIFTVGSGLPPKGTVYLGTVNGESPVFEGDLILPNDGRATIIVANAFNKQRQLTSIVIPDSVTSIEESAFRNCSHLTNVSFGENSHLTSIGNEVFYNCSSLTSIDIPSSVTSIGNGAFYNCNSVTNVYITDIAAWCNIPFSSLDARPCAKNLYLNNELVTELTIPNTITEIKPHVFYDCTSLTSVIIPDSVTSIGEYAFLGCSGLTSVIIPDSVTSIGVLAFSYCSSLTSIELPDSVTSIDNGAFRYCSSLTSIQIPDSVTSIVESAFEDCTSLESIQIPDSVTSIGSYAFNNCSSLTSIIFSGTILEWNAITKGTNWNLNVPATHVHCTDGDVAL